jgi:hypothetical protein
VSGAISKFVALPTREKLLFVEAWLTLAATGLSLRRNPRRALEGCLQHLDGRDDAETAQLIARAAGRAAARQFYVASCLPRSLAILKMLRRRGIEAQLKVGGQLADQRYLGHAWVESNGMALGEKPDVEERFPSLHLHEEALLKWNYHDD